VATGLLEELQRLEVPHPPAPPPAPPPPPPPVPPPPAPPPVSVPEARESPGARAAEATASSAAALQYFLKDDHEKARQAVERALALDPSNRRAQELQKILSVLG